MAETNCRDGESKYTKPTPEGISRRDKINTFFSGLGLGVLALIYFFVHLKETNLNTE